MERSRRALPPPRRDRPATGHWLGPGSDTSVVRSGTGDQWYEKARRLVLESFPREDWKALVVARHVEVKVAMRMKPGGDETLVMDRRVCGRNSFDEWREDTCDRYLDRYLPAEATLRVVEPDGTVVTYRGRTSR